MSVILLYIATAIVFLVLDIVVLKRVMHPLFSKYIGNILLEDPKMWAAAVFYLLYIVGILYFVSLPVLGMDNPLNAVLPGLVLGAMAYGTYEFTNYATVQGWSPKMVVIDLVWGSVLTAVSAVGGLWLHSMFV